MLAPGPVLDMVVAMRHVITQFLQIAIVCLGVISLSAQTHAADTPAEAYQWYPVEPKIQVPDIVFRTEGGKSATLADFKGKRVVLNFWASWCGPCITELPTLDWLARQHPKEALVVLVMNIEKFPFEKAEDFIRRQLKLKHITLAQDQLGTLYDALSQGVLPMTYVIDATGHLEYAYIGATNWVDKQHLPYILGKE